MIELYELAGADPAIRFSPYCWRVRMALAHKGLTAHMVPWHFGDRNLPGGNKQVPVLVDDGEVIADSTAIALYLENRYHNGPSLFGGESGEAHIRFIIAWTDRVLNRALLPVLAPDIEKLLRPDQKEQFRQTREARMGMSFADAEARRDSLVATLRGVVTPVRGVLDHSAFLGGTEPSYADYSVFGSFQWARCVSDTEILAQDDPVLAWRERMLDLFDEYARRTERAAASGARQAGAGPVPPG